MNKSLFDIYKIDSGSQENYQLTLDECRKTFNSCMEETQPLALSLQNQTEMKTMITEPE